MIVPMLLTLPWTPTAMVVGIVRVAPIWIVRLSHCAPAVTDGANGVPGTITAFTAAVGAPLSQLPALLQAVLPRPVQLVVCAKTGAQRNATVASARTPARALNGPRAVTSEDR